jgi:hypothetical protein
MEDVRKLLQKVKEKVAFKHSEAVVLQLLLEDLERIVQDFDAKAKKKTVERETTAEDITKPKTKAKRKKK